MVGGKSLCSHRPLCQQLVTVATSKKSLSLIDTVAGSGVFNCIISFFLFLQRLACLWQRPLLFHFFLSHHVFWHAVYLSAYC